MDLGAVALTLVILNLPVIGAGAVYFLLLRRAKRVDGIVLALLVVSSYFTLVPSYELAYPALTGQVVAIPLATLVLFSMVGAALLFVAVFALRAYRSVP